MRTRRDILKSSGVVAATLAVSAAAVATARPAEDAELRRLYAELQDLLRHEREACDRHQEARQAFFGGHDWRYDDPAWRAAFDAMSKEEEQRWRDQFNRLADLAYGRDGDAETPLSALSDSWNALHRKCLEARAAVLEAPAEGMLGIALKLTARFPDADGMDGQDFEEAIGCVLADLERLTGETFPGAKPGAWRWWLEGDDDELATV